MKKQQALEKFNNYLDSQNLRKSSAREEIVREIFSLDKHFHIQELIDKLNMKNISRASVFRTIQLLLEADLLQKTTDLHGHVHYEQTFSDEHHDHLICIKCGKELEFTSAEIERLQREICKKNKFKSLTHSLQIWGYCEECQKSRV